MKRRVMTMVLALVMVVGVLGFGVLEVRAASTGFTTEPMIAAGTLHTVVLRNDGTVWAWGRNSSGVLGSGTTIDHHTPIQVQGFSNVMAVSAGSYHTVALRNDGTVWAWGGNRFGELGDGTSGFSHTFVQVQDLGNVTAIAASSGFYTVALRSDGTVWAWGFNRWGQLGDGTTTDRYAPVQVQSLSNVTAISAGNYHATALRNDGTVWAWGANWSGRLGDGTYIGRLTPVQVKELSGVIAIAAGWECTVALRNDGTVWAWGDNRSGQLGDGTTTTRLAPVQVQNLSGVTAIATGRWHTVALRNDGTVWTWGRNNVGQLGDGTTADRHTPVQVQNLSGVTAIEAGRYYTVALRNDGTVWAWGLNGSGQLGDGTTTDRHTPTQVLGPDGIGFLNLLDSAPTHQNPLSPAALATITDTPTAVSAVRAALEASTPEELTTGHLELFADNAIARAASVNVSTGVGGAGVGAVDGILVDGAIVINQSNVRTLETTALQTRSAIEQMLLAQNYELLRDLNANISFVTDNYNHIDIRIEPSAALTEVEHIRIRTEHYEFSLPPTFIESDIADAAPLEVTITRRANSLPMYDVAFSRPVETTTRLSVPPIAGDPSFQTLQNSAGQAVGGMHNPATGMLDARIMESDTFIVVENRVSFGDIQHLSQEAQRAIEVLASQGIISGTGAEQFSPGSHINRAQYASLVTRMLGVHNPNTDGGFVDVQRGDWFFGAAGSANRHGLMHGTGANIFSPLLVIPRDQLVAVSARVLRNEMGYRDPANPNAQLQAFTDRNDLADWSINDLALAVRENLIIHRADGRFMPNESMTRGDAALILYRLYLRLW